MSVPSKVPPSTPVRSKRERTRTVAIVVLAVVVTVFAVLNLNSVKVDWIIGSGHAPLIVVVALSVLVGAALVGLAERASSRRRGRPPED